MTSQPQRPRAGAGVVSRRRTRVKICGVTSVAAAIAAVDAGADAIGVVFAADSPRYVRPHDANQIVRALPPFVMPVGVFRQPTDPDLRSWSGDWLQVHGRIDEQQLARTQNRQVIVGFSFDAAQVQKWDASPLVRAMLIDGSDGGAGTSFDHALLANLMKGVKTPVILAGGLTPENVADAIRAVRPFAVDVSSGVESAPGVKDPARIRAFCQAVRDADASLR